MAAGAVPAFVSGHADGRASERKNVFAGFERQRDSYENVGAAGNSGRRNQALWYFLGRFAVFSRSRAKRGAGTAVFL